MIGAYRDRLRQEALGEEPRQGKRYTVDEVYELLIEHTTQKLETRTSMLFTDVISSKTNPKVVCYKTSIAYRQTFGCDNLSSSTTAVESALGT